MVKHFFLTKEVIESLGEHFTYYTVQKYVFDLFLTKDCSSILKNSISNRNLSKEDKKFSINLAKSAGYFSYWFNTMYDKLNSADKEYKEYCSNPEDFFDKNSTTEGTINVFRN